MTSSAVTNVDINDECLAAGHSLGAGVASLAAPWAALQWPGADIRCVTIGNPKPGNQAYSEVSTPVGLPAAPTL